MVCTHNYTKISLTKYSAVGSGTFFTLNRDTLSSFPDQPVTDLVIGVLRKDNITQNNYYIQVEAWTTLVVGKIHQEVIEGSNSHDYKFYLTTSATSSNRTIEIRLRGSWMSSSVMFGVCKQSSISSCRDWIGTLSEIDNEMVIVINDLPATTTMLYMRIAAPSNIISAVYDVAVYESK